MKNRRKAELQRKLHAAPLPKPPAGLSERIKRDIPPDFHYSTNSDRSRFSMFNALSLRVAASILVLVGGAYFTIRLMSEAEKREFRSKSAIALPQNAPAPAAPQPAVATRIALADQASAPAEPKPALQPVARRQMEVAGGVKQKDRERDDEQQNSIDGLDKGDAASGVSAGVIAANEPQETALSKKVADTTSTSTVAEPQKAEESKELRFAGGKPASRAEASAPPPPAAAPLASRPPAQAAPAEMMTAQQELSIVAPPPQLFGISTDREAFDRIKFAIEHGDRPAAASVDVAALVNYFAGSPERTRHAVTLDLEASTRPVGDGNPTALVRVSVDTEETIYDAKLDIQFDEISVAEYHRIGGNHIASATEPVVNANRSVTTLYEVRLKPNVRQRQAVATATLVYRGANGAQTLTRWVSYGEAQGTWKSRSRRHRLATLGAIWAETLRTSAAGNDVAATAEQLSKQEPRDEKAKELAALATASSRLRSSSPTGSGR
jgi:hypothetical protein